MSALADPTTRARFSELGLDAYPREQQTPDALAAFQKTEIEQWWAIIKAAGIKPEQGAPKGPRLALPEGGLS